MGEPIDCILYMFMRPGELICLPKGEENVVFDIPKEYLPEKYQPFADEIMKHCHTGTNNRMVKIKPIDCTDCCSCLNLGRHEQFSVFIPEHRRMTGKLIDIFMEKKTCEELLSVAAYCRDRVNSYMFIYALSVALLHRPDTKHLSIPPLSSVFPHLFIDSVTFTQAKEAANLIPAEIRQPIVIKKDHTASDLEPEHRLAYFREDLGINHHHHHWHKVYPFAGSKEMVGKNRRGELFYYMHQQIVARYNFERLSNHLMRVKSFCNWQEPIMEGYFSKLGTDSSATICPGRHSGATLKDVDLPKIQFELQDLGRVRDRIFEAIHRRQAVDTEGNVVDLKGFDGIDVLGNMVEATVLSPNLPLYGNLHNNGHVAIAACHDPDFRHLEDLGVMGNDTTAMRDPIFYRWHAFIDDIFQEHKNLLTPYTEKDLGFEEMQVDGVEVTIEDEPTEAFYTHWQQSNVDISGGLDFSKSGATLVQFTHLQHEPFSYKITVTNNSDMDKVGTVRIFMAPSNDERGLPFTLEKQRRLMIEMDKFTTTFALGENLVIRRSDESSVTIPFEQTFPKLDVHTSIDKRTVEEEHWCGCGWPQHMLIPKGTVKGLEIDVFVMVSDFAGDEINQPRETRCSKDASAFCGLRDKFYPDARSMGYPFDRPLQNPADNFTDFCRDNMTVKKMSIVFTGETISEGPNANMG